MTKSLVSRMAAVTFAFGAFTLGSTAHGAETPALAAAGKPSVLRAACEMNGPHTDFKGTDINMRNRPGGDHVGWANQGDCADLFQTDPGPEVQCPDGQSTVAWHSVRNKRTGVVGYVSGCYLGS
jgi:hypothetical protein